MSSRIKRIFFDTNPLHQSWPGISVTVENTLVAARKLNIAVEIPDPVLIELKRNWSERMQSKLRSIERDLTELGRFVPGFELSPGIPDYGTVSAGFDKAAGMLTHQWGIQITPMPSLPVADVFGHAVRRELVFEDQGKNFQDAVIFLAVIERMARCPEESAVLITDDGIFTKREPDLEQYAADRRISLRFWKLRDADDQLRSMLDEAAKLRFSQHKELAKAAVKANLGEFQQLFNSRLQDSDFFPPYPTDVWRDVQFSRVTDAEAAVLEDEPRAGERVKLAAILSGSADVVRLVPSGTNRPQIVQGRQPIDVGATMSATFDGAKYQDLKLSGWTYGGPPYPGSVVLSSQAT